MTPTSDPTVDPILYSELKGSSILEVDNSLIFWNLKNSVSKAQGICDMQQNKFEGKVTTIFCFIFQRLDHEFTATLPVLPS